MLLAAHQKSVNIVALAIAKVNKFTADDTKPLVINKVTVLALVALLKIK